jgi:hypothetical protein
VLYCIVLYCIVLLGIELSYVRCVMYDVLMCLGWEMFCVFYARD